MSIDEQRHEAALKHASRYKLLAFLKKWLSYFKEVLFDRGLKYTYTWLLELIVRLVRGAPLRHFSEITPQIFIGGQQRKRGWPVLKSWGITSVVNLRSRFDDHNAGVTSEPYLHLPTRDGTPPTLEQLHEGIKFIKEQVKNGGAVYIHCEAGVGRSVTMMAAYLIAEQGLTPTEAWVRIRSVRPFIRPTKSQKAKVVRFAAQIRKTRSGAAKEQRLAS